MKGKRVARNRKKVQAKFAVVVDYLGGEIPRSIHVVDADFCKEHPEAASIDLEIDLRLVDVITIKPLRRPMKDTAGIVEDALRLANTPI